MEEIAGESSGSIRSGSSERQETTMHVNRWYTADRNLGAIVFPRRDPGHSARGKVSDDWITALPREKNQVFQAVVGRWECTYAMMSVALDDALSLRARGELVCGRQQVSIAADLLGRLSQSLISLCGTLSVRGKRISRLPIVQPLNTKFFRGNTGQSAASWNGILHHVLFGKRARFFHKLRILTETIEQIEREFHDAAGDISKGLSVQPGDCWGRLDALHYDFNTCLRETEVVLKAFLRAVPTDQLPSLCSEWDAPSEPKRLRIKPRLSRASA
jgi:hypothetical protein